MATTTEKIVDNGDGTYSRVTRSGGGVDSQGNPTAGVPTQSGVLDSTGAIIFPDSMTLTAVTRDTAGNLLTSTRSDGTNSWVQTITRDTNGNLSTQSKWVRQ